MAEAGPRRATSLGPRLVKAENANAWFDGQAELAAARAEAARIIQEARAVYESERARGLKEGRQEGAAQGARLLADVHARIAAETKRREAALGDIVVAALRRIFGAVEPDRLMFKAVRHALEERALEDQIVLLVARGSADALKQYLDNHLQAPLRQMITVDVDPEMRPGDCVMRSAFGVVELGIEAQLEALHEAFRRVDEDDV